MADAKPPMTVDKYKELTTVPKYVEDVKANMFHGSTFAKVFKVGLGAGLVTSGVVDTYSALTAERDPNKPEADGSTLVKVGFGATKILAGLALARHGGEKLATSHLA